MSGTPQTIAPVSSAAPDRTIDPRVSRITSGNMPTLTTSPAGKRKQEQLARSTLPTSPEAQMQTAADAAAEQLRTNARKAGSGGRQSTILTTPLGVVNTAPTTAKTLLGS